MSVKEQLEAVSKDAAPVVESAPAVATPEAAAPAEAANSEAIANATETMQAAAYQPNFKFKYTGKNGDKWGDAEGEFDEPIKASIKSKEDEEKWQKMYSKANGFDFVQEGREKARKEFSDYKSQVDPLISMAQKANQALVKEDSDTLFETLNIPDKIILKHAYKLLQMQDLQQTNPQQYNLYTQNQQQNKQLQTYQEQMAQIQSQNLQIEQTLLQNELNNEYSKPEVASFKQAFEAANGENSFYEELKLRADFIHQSQNRIPRPSEVIQDVLKRFGPFLSQSSATQTQSAPSAQSSPQTVVATQKPTITMVGGGGQSPSGKTFKSLKDLRAHRETLK
jgi:hypothetical protein